MKYFFKLLQCQYCIDPLNFVEQSLQLKITFPFLQITEPYDILWHCAHDGADETMWSQGGDVLAQARRWAQSSQVSFRFRAQVPHGKPCWDQGCWLSRSETTDMKGVNIWCDVAEPMGLYGRMVDGLHIWLFSQGYSKRTLWLQALSRHKMSLLKSTNLSRATATATLFMCTFWWSWIAKLLACRRNAAFCEKLREVLKIPRKCFDWKKVPWGDSSKSSFGAHKKKAPKQ